MKPQRTEAAGVYLGNREVFFLVREQSEVGVFADGQGVSHRKKSQALRNKVCSTGSGCVLNRQSNRKILSCSPTATDREQGSCNRNESSK